VTEPGLRQAVEEATSGGLPRAMLGRLPVVVKHVPDHELAVHRLLEARLPGVVPPILASWPASDGPGWVMVLPELAMIGRPSGIDLLRAGIDQVALVHAIFADSTEPAARTRPDPAQRAAAAPPRAGVLARLDSAWSLGLGPDRLDDWAQLEVELPSYGADLGQAPTLVHGDLHLGNMLPRDNGTALLIDWGSTGRTGAPWDLATAPAALISAYLDARGRHGRRPDLELFHRQLRAAVVLRLHDAVGDLLDDAVSARLPSGLRAEALRRSVCRALRARADPQFLGG
jgi:hypothetical protein